jgi:hypothetical protein
MAIESQIGSSHGNYITVGPVMSCSGYSCEKQVIMRSTKSIGIVL